MRTETSIKLSAVVLLLTALIVPEGFKEYVAFCWEKAPYTGLLLAIHYGKPILRWLRFLLYA